MTDQEWIFDKHSSTNHFYDTYLPYEFHLRMVEFVGDKFMYLLDDKIPFYEFSFYKDSHKPITEKIACKRALPGHDLIEDTRTSYNDVKEKLGQEAADIIYAVSNEKGKNRKERANEKYYAGIRAQKGAVFVKLCDRIANVQYGKMTYSKANSMFEKYKKENDNFIKELGYEEGHRFTPMFEYLKDLFKK